MRTQPRSTAAYDLLSLAAAPPRQPRPIDIFVGTRLRTKRRALGLSQHDLAVATKMPVTWIEEYERGRERILPRHLIAFGQVLGVGLTFFFGGPAAARGGGANP